MASEANRSSAFAAKEKPRQANTAKSASTNSTPARAQKAPLELHYLLDLTAQVKKNPAAFAHELAGRYLTFGFSPAADIRPLVRLNVSVVAGDGDWGSPSSGDDDDETFLPQQVVMHAYTMMPLPSAAQPPSLAAP